MTPKEYEQQLRAHPALSKFIDDVLFKDIELFIDRFSKRVARKFSYADKIYIIFCKKEDSPKEEKPVEVICKDEENWSDSIMRVAGQGKIKEIFKVSEKKGGGKIITIFSTPTRTATDANFRRKLETRARKRGLR